MIFVQHNAAGGVTGRQAASSASLTITVITAFVVIGIIVAHLLGGRKPATA